MEEIMQVSERRGQVKSVLACLGGANDSEALKRRRLALGHVMIRQQRADYYSLLPRFQRSQQIALSLRACSWMSCGTA
jgi:hypothetical protein